MIAVTMDEQTPTDAALLKRFVTETNAAAFAMLVERHGVSLGVRARFCMRLSVPCPDREGTANP